MMNPLESRVPAGIEKFCSRRNFMKTGALGVGLGLTAPLAAQFPGPNAMPMPLSIPPMPLAPSGPNFNLEIPAGVTPQAMLGAARQFVATLLNSLAVTQVADVRPIQIQLPTFHGSFASDYVILGQIPPVRTRFGYFMEMNQFLRTDSVNPPRIYKDLNYFEMRRVLHPTEIGKFGMPLHPCGHRTPPTPIDVQEFYRVARECYALPNPAEFRVLYRRRFSNDVHSFWGYFVALNPAPGRPPFLDLYIDNRPMV